MSEPVLKISVDDLISNLIYSFRSCDTVVFCGAGISYNSGVPIVSDIVSFILHLLDVSRRESRIVMRSRLPFEAFVEILWENCNMEKFFEIYSLGEPNTNYILLAKLVKSGFLKTIVTTNFDRLIEKAFEKEGLREGKDYSVHYRHKYLSRIDWDSNKARLVKIHGSVESMEEIVSTLQQVAKQTLSVQRRHVIDHVFSSGNHTNVLVLGYSSSDVFDICPHIQTIKGDRKRVIYVEHAFKSRVDDITVKKYNNPFIDFSGSHRLYTNTDKLVNKLWVSLLKDEEYIFIQKKTPWTDHVEKWLDEEISEDMVFTNYKIAGEIFFKISRFKIATMYLEEALKTPFSYLDEENRASIFTMLGDIYCHLGDYEKAIYEYYLPAVDYAKESENKKLLTAILRSVGDACEHIGDHNLATRYYRQCIHLADGKDKKEEAIFLNKMGNVWRYKVEADLSFNLFNRALKIAKNIGDKELELSVLNNLGDFHRNQKEHNKAINDYKQALKIAELIGNKRQEGIILGSLGDVYINIGKYEMALDFINRSLKIAKAVYNKEEEAAQFFNMGNACYELKRYKEAIESYGNALEFYETFIGKSGLGGDVMEKQVKKTDLLFRLGTTHTIVREYHKAIEYFEESLSAAYILEDNELKFHINSNLGTLHMEINNYKSADYYFRKALEIAIKIKKKEWELNMLIYLGSVNIHLKELQNAEDYYMKAIKISNVTGDEIIKGESFMGLGIIKFNLGEYKKSMEFSKQARSILKPLLGDNHKLTKTARKNVINAASKHKEKLLKLKKQVEALKNIRRQQKLDKL